MNKNILQNYFFVLYSFGVAAVAVFYFWRQFFTTYETVSSLLFFPGWRIEYMHESPFHFLCFRFVQKVILSSDRYYIATGGSVRCSSTTTARTTVKREAKRNLLRRIFVFHLFSNFLSRVSLLTARIAVSPNYFAFFFSFPFFLSFCCFLRSGTRHRVSLLFSAPCTTLS